MALTQETLTLMALSCLFRNKLRKACTLLEHYGSAVETWKHIEEENMSAAMQRAEKEADFVEKHNIIVFARHEDTYPTRLRQCPDAPLVLYGKGRCNTNSGKMISVVGTRDCTDRGRELARRLVLDLASMLPDVTIISGLAYGIDIAAHRAALEAGAPTFVITGHGMDRIYPAIHRDVAVKALTKGGVLTEYMSRTEPDRQNFVARDRIIAGMADAVVVVESHEKGGALITAHMALDYSRSLFALPGRVSDPASRGCNMLIRDSKAALIETAEDLVKAMMWDNDATLPEIEGLFPETGSALSSSSSAGGSGRAASSRSALQQTSLSGIPLTEDEQRILDLLAGQDEGVHINFLQAETGISYSDTASALTMLEMKGAVRSLPGGIFRATT
ncbi:MAG: DNA-processing protein DprA [Paludibacteraceae bacterium]|nr:DNA-processing protein DprA [Paludibacteraceae bacterium]